MILLGKLNSARYILQVVNPVLLPFLRQEGDVLLQQDNARPHTAAKTQRALRCVQLPCSVEHVRGRMKRELTLSPVPATTIAELRQRVKYSWESLSQDEVCMRKYTPALPPEEVHSV